MDRSGRLSIERNCIIDRNGSLGCGRSSIFEGMKKRLSRVSLCYGLGTTFCLFCTVSLNEIRKIIFKPDPSIAKVFHNLI